MSPTPKKPTLLGDAVPFDLPFEEAMDYFRSKGFAFSSESWQDVWKDANARSFTVAQVTEMDVLVDIRKEVQAAIDSGTTLEEFKANLVPTLESKGWWAPSGEKAIVELPDGSEMKRLAPWRLQTIFETNVQTAYAVGRYTQMMSTAEQRPIWIYHAILDANTRPEHAAQDGKAYDYQHPFWNEWYPPCGFGCRCYVSTATPEEAAEEGIEIQTAGVAERPDPGWDYNVGAAGLAAYEPDLSKYPPELVRQMREAA